MGEIDKQQQQDLFTSPGQKLREAREAQGWSVAEVADKLYWTKQRVVDLENNDYSKIPSMLYIRGYLRSYTKLLELPEAEILADIERPEHVKPEPPVKLENSKTPSKKAVARRRHYLRWINLAIIALLIILVLLWQHTDNHLAKKLAAFGRIVKQVVIPSPGR